MRSSINAAGRVLIPKRIRDMAGWVADMPVEITYRDGRIEIMPGARAVVFVRKGRVAVARATNAGVPLTSLQVRDSPTVTSSLGSTVATTQVSDRAGSFTAAPPHASLIAPTVASSNHKEHRRSVTRSIDDAT